MPLYTSTKNKNVHIIIVGYLYVIDLFVYFGFFIVSKYKWDNKLKAYSLCKNSNPVVQDLLKIQMTL